MNVKVAVLAAVLAAVIRLPAFAAAVPKTTGASEISEEVGQLKDAVASNATEDVDVYKMAQDIFGRLPSTQIVVHVNLRGWDREPAPEKDPATIDRLIETSDKRLAYYNKDVPSPDVVKAFAYAKGMRRSGQMDFDKDNELSDNQMGVYKYLVHKIELGTIELNNLLGLFATRMGDAIAFATVMHEAGHARDHHDGKLNPQDVIEGEIRAFKTQYLWLKIADPYDERICFMRTIIKNEQRVRPTKVGAMADAYLDHLAELQATGGDEKELRKLVEKLGYKDGEGRSKDSSIGP